MEKRVGAASSLIGLCLLQDIFELANGVCSRRQAEAITRKNTKICVMKTDYAPRADRVQVKLQRDFVSVPKIQTTLDMMRSEHTIASQTLKVSFFEEVTVMNSLQQTAIRLQVKQEN
jgi:hypothetical protein